jgi:hypothetical protein
MQFGLAGNGMKVKITIGHNDLCEILVRSQSRRHGEKHQQYGTHERTGHIFMIDAAPAGPIGHWANRTSREMDRGIVMGRGIGLAAVQNGCQSTIEPLLACRADGAGPVSAIGAKQTLAE